MPELPEVETIRQDLKKKILNQKINKIDIINKKSVRNAADIFVRALKGNYFSEISRVGKLLILHLHPGNKFLLIHLKMTGQLIYKSKQGMVAGGHGSEPDMELPNKHTRVVIELADKTKLFFNDLRKFGYLEIVDRARLEKIKSKFGIEPLTKDYTLSRLKEIIKKRKAPIKAVLLNQNLIAGIGNIYADEILFAARVRPDRTANGLTDKEIKRIYENGNKIIKKAIEYRGTTFNNYVDADGKRGNFMNFLRIYSKKEGEKCFRCPGNIIKVKVAGRGTRFCPKCQS